MRVLIFSLFFESKQPKMALFAILLKFQGVIRGIKWGDNGVLWGGFSGDLGVFRVDGDVYVARNKLWQSRLEII